MRAAEQSLVPDPKEYRMDADKQEAATDPDGWLGKTKSSGHILYAGDDVATRSIVERVLAHLGYRVQGFNDGSAAWKALNSENYDLLIASQVLPSMSGVQLAMNVRLAGMRLPIVLISEHAKRWAEPPMEWLEVAGYLPKPFGPRALVEIVETSLVHANPFHACHDMRPRG